MDGITQMQRATCRRRAHNNCPVRGKASKIQVKLFFIYESGKELDGGAFGRGGLVTP